MSISDFANSTSEESKVQWKDETEKQSHTTTSAPTQSPSSSDVAQTAVVNEPASDTQAPVDDILNSLMGNIEEIGQSSTFKLMLYGDPGTTKSSLAATAPNNLIVDLEDGLISAKSSPHGIANNVKRFPWKGFDALSVLITKLLENPKELEWVEVLTIDSFSDLHKRALAEITEREWRKRPSSNRFVPETEHHQENNERIYRLLRTLRELNRDLIITAHSKTVEPKNKPPKTYSDFSESLNNKIMGLMDIVGHMSMKEVDGKMVPVMRVITDDIIQCKTRVPLPEEIINPTWPMLKAAWQKSLDEGSYVN